MTNLPEHQRTGLGMGRTFQITNVFPDLTLIENLALSIVGTDRRKWIVHRPVSAFPALREQALAGLAAVGLDDRAEESVKLLSYGERRQLELALALNTAPKVLFLDEPCAGLSPSERQRIFQMIRSLPRDITVVLIEHDMDVALGLADTRHGDEPRPRHGGGNAGRRAAQPGGPRRVFRPCLTPPRPWSPCCRSPRSTPITATATCCRA